MPTPVDVARNDSVVDSTQSDDMAELARICLAKVAMADAGEESRRQNDRIGARLYYGHHWGVNPGRNRSALTYNVTKAVIEHKISIMTKQKPIPVVEPGEAGDYNASIMMRGVLMRWWDDDAMQVKTRRAARIANATRTNALKVVWDPTLHGGAGNMTTDVIPGWRLILDPRAQFVDRMEFVGHREMMRRPMAIMLYPEAADLIYSGVGKGRRGTPSGSSPMASSPIGDAYKRGLQAGGNFGTIVNGKPVISAFTNQPARGSTGEDDSVQVIELYHRDYTLHEEEVEQFDPLGNARREIERDEDGIPQFEELPHDMQMVDGIAVAMPNYRLKMKPVMHVELKRIYPHWRRTTLLVPDGTVLEDIAWDGPLPYALVSDGDTLEGPWVRGCALDCEDPQVTLNVSLSLMMDNLRMSSMRPVLAGQASGLAGQSLLVAPGQVVNVMDPTKVVPFEFPTVAQPWFEWCNMQISLMQQIVGLSGVMQGESTGRVDSASGYDTLAEIGGSRIVEATQSLEYSIAQCMKIAGWYAQRYYTDKHALAVEDATGNLTYERVSGPFLYGTFDYKIAVGSTMAWSESAVRQRLLTELQAGLIDKIEYWQRTATPNWRQIAKRIQSQNPILSGAAGAPPPRTRTSAKKVSSHGAIPKA